jgi:hypothetical protein
VGKQASRILRNYRNAAPSKFHTINQRVATALTDNGKIPESTWSGNPTLLADYLAASKKHDSLHHEALHGSKLVIAERDLLGAQIIIYLDEIALLLEAAALRIPDILLVSGFGLAKERRSYHRTIVQSTASEASAGQSDQT